MRYSSRITGTGSFFPARIISNEELCLVLSSKGGDVPENFGPQWIEERTGIQNRHFSEPGNPDETCSSLGAQAARFALERAKLKPIDLDGIIFATCTPDTPIPSAACLLQAKIQAVRAWALDINAACSGFQHALTLAHSMIATGQSQKILVVGADVLSSVTDFDDRKSCILFGDGAGAVILEREDFKSGRGIIASHLGANGQLADLFQMRSHLDKMQMKGSEIFKTSVRSMLEMTHQVLADTNLKNEDITWVVPHQANLRILEALGRKLKIPMDRFILNIQDRGNTSAATVPSALDQAVLEGKFKSGDLILINVFGAGVTYGATLLRW
jgi:3-oxoacyl-[acyl-carrier-protein] synthase-3